MNVGLPTTGVGGIFYLASALMTLPIEIIYTLMGRSNKIRWLFVLRQNVLAVLIIGTLYLTGYLLKSLIHIKTASTSAQHFASSYGTITFNPIILFVVLLVIVDTSTYLWLTVKNK